MFGNDGLKKISEALWDREYKSAINRRRECQRNIKAIERDIDLELNEGQLDDVKQSRLSRLYEEVDFWYRELSMANDRIESVCSV